MFEFFVMLGEFLQISLEPLKMWHSMPFATAGPSIYFSLKGVGIFKAPLL